MKKMNLVVIMLITAALFTAGCLGGDDEPTTPQLSFSTVTEDVAGFCGSPDYDSPEASEYSHLFSAPNGSQVVAYVFELSWTDDYEGDGANTYDEFKVSAAAGNTTGRENSDTGSLTLLIGGENLDIDANASGDSISVTEDMVKTDFTSLGETCDITVECMSAGVYPKEGVGGRLVGYYDPGNSWSLKITAYVMTAGGAVETI